MYPCTSFTQSFRIQFFRGFAQRQEHRGRVWCIKIAKDDTQAAGDLR